MAKSKMDGMRKVNFLVSRDSWAELEREAASRFTTRSQILRDLIGKALSRFAEEEKLKQMMAKGA